MKRTLLIIVLALVIAINLINLSIAAIDLNDLRLEIKTNIDHNIIYFSKIFVFLVVFVIVSLFAMPKFTITDSSFIKTIISICVALLSALFIPDEFLKTALYPYSAIGFLFIGLLPFILIFFFLKNSIKNLFFNRIFWIFFSIYCFSLGLYYRFYINMLTPLFFWFYLAEGIIALIIAYYAKHIYRFFWQSELEGKVKNIQEKQELKNIRKEYENLSDI